MSTPGFRSFSPPLKWFMVATVVNMIGSAAMFGFVLIYFHEIRGIPLSQAGLAAATMSFAMVLLTPVAGFLADHLGARRVLTMGCFVSIMAAVAYAFVENIAVAVAVSVLLGVGNALWFPAQAALLSLIVTQAQRPAVMAWQRAALNLGAAMGGVVGGLLLHRTTLHSFYWLFALNAATYVLFLGVLPFLPNGRVPKEDRAGKGEGFAVVLRDRFFVRLLITDLSIALGFGFLWAVTPAYASTIGIDKLTIGFLFTVGSAGVALSQLPTLRWIRGGKRMNWLMGMNGWFVGAFLLMLVTPHVTAGIAVAFIAAAQVCGGFGEAILGAVRTPLTSDLAPPELVGRYFGLATMVFHVCTGLSFAIGGALMQRSLSAVWVLPLVGCVLGITALYRLRHQIPAHAAVSA